MSTIIPDGSVAAAMNTPLAGPQIERSTISFWDPARPYGPNDGTDEHGNFQGFTIFTGVGPLYSDNPWDVVSIAGKKLPGLCSVKCEPQLQIDQQKGPKHDGARLTLHGYLPGPCEISVTIWTEGQWAEFLRLIPSFWRRPDKDPKDLAATAKANKVSTRDAALIQAAVAVDHPAFAMYGINQVIVKGMSQPEDGPVPQSKIVRIKCIEFVAPTKKTAPSKVKHAKNAAADERVVTSSPPSKTATGPRGANHSPGA